MTEPPMHLPFDEITVVDDGVPQRMSPQEFMDLSLILRTRAILERRVTFMNLGVEVSAEVAMRALLECSRPK